MATTFPTASTAGRKRSRKSLTDASTEMKRQHEAAGEMTTDHAHHGSSSADEEKWAVQLLLLLKATDSARMLSDDDSDNDSDDQSESEAGDDDDNDDDGSESEEAEVEVEAEEEEYDNEVDSKTHVTPTPLLSVRRSARTKRSSGAMSAGDYVWGEAAAVEDETAPMAVEGEAQVEADDESDVDDRASAVVHQQQRDLSKDNQERPGDRGGHHQASAMMEEDDHGSSNEDEQPEEEEFSEGDEYVDPSSSSSSRRTRNYNNASGAVHTLTKAGASDNQLTILPVSASAAGAPTPQFTASRSASPSSPAPGGGKKTRKPKYSAALEARWEEKFEWLMSYRRAKGNCRVAEGNKEYPGLGKWLSNQKTLCKKGKLKAERRQKLIDVGAIADPALKAAARLGASQSPPSSPASLASPLPSSSIAHLGGDDEDAQGPLTKRRRKGHSLVVNIDRIPSMSSDQEVDSAVSSPSAASGLFSSSSPFRTYQGKPILPSLSFPHPMAPGGLHTHLPQQPQAQQQGLGGSTSFLSFALGAMPPVLFSPFSILGAPPGPTTNHLAPSHL